MLLRLRHPEGYRKAMAKMRLAAKFHMPVVCFIDTPGAYPGIGAEERGQAQVIATSMYEMSRLPTPIVCVVIGEGGSGGALGIGVGDRVSMLEHAYYSVISPEGCAGILWKSHTFKERAAEALKMTSKDLLQLGVVDDVIREPLGGAHRDHHLMASRLKIYLRSCLRELVGQPVEQLLERRYEKFRRMGVFLEGPAAELAAGPDAALARRRTKVIFDRPVANLLIPQSKAAIVRSPAMNDALPPDNSANALHFRAFVLASASCEARILLAALLALGAVYWFRFNDEGRREWVSLWETIFHAQLYRAEQTAAAALAKQGILVVREPPDNATTSVNLCGKPLDDATASDCATSTASSRSPWPAASSPTTSCPV